MSTTPALILAAGRGSRMGTPKALMRADGQYWWQEQLSRLHQANIEPIWVLSTEVNSLIGVGSLGPARTVLSDSARPMFSSILAGIDSLRPIPPRGVFILPIDVPASQSPALWQSLLSDSVPSAPVFRGKRGHPIFLPWKWITSRLDPQIAGIADPDRLRLDELLRDSVLEIPVNDPVVLCNLNTPEDLRRFVDAPASD